MFASSLMILLHLVLADSVHPCLSQVCGWENTNSYTPIYNICAKRELQIINEFHCWFFTTQQVHHCFALKLQNALKTCSGDHESTSSSCLSLPHAQENQTQHNCHANANKTINSTWDTMSLMKLWNAHITWYVYIYILYPKTVAVICLSCFEYQ